MSALVKIAPSRRGVFLGLTALLAVTVVVLAHEVMLPFVLAIVIAYLLTPAVGWVERRNVPRGLAIILVYVLVLGSIALFLDLTVPRVAQEVGSMRREIPVLTQTAQKEWVPAMQAKLRAWGALPPPAPVEAPKEETAALVVHPRADGSYGVDVGTGLVVTPARGGGFTIDEPREQKEPVAFEPNRFFAESLSKSIAYAQTNAFELVRIGRDIVAGVSRAIFIFGITLMLAAYLILTREKIGAFFLALVRPSQRESAKKLAARIDRGLAGVVRGQIIICVINGVLSAIGFAFIGLKFWPVLALVATVLSLIPIFGSITSAIPAVALGLTQGLPTAAFVLVWIIGIHQLEANILNPKIMGDAAKIHPVLIIFSLLVGEHFFHALGALLAVPVMSMAQSAFIHFRHVIDASDPELAAETLPSVPPPR